MALDIYQRDGSDLDPGMGTVLNNLGILRQKQGRFLDARIFYERSLKTRQARLDPHHPQIAESASNFGLHLQMMGELEEAARLYRRALAIREKVLGPDSSVLGVTLNNIALLHWQRGDLQKAEEVFRRVAEIWRREATDSAVALSNLGGVLVDRGHLVDAEPKLRRALAIREIDLWHGEPWPTADPRAPGQTRRPTG